MSQINLARTWIKPVSKTLSAPVPPPVEIVEVGEYPPIDWEAASTTSTNSTGGYEQKAVLPVDSILEDWFNYARRFTEGAQCYLCGAILPVLGATLARRVWLPLGGGPKYPNVFTLICGKPGDRKSTTIRLAAAMARRCLPAVAFLPASFSPESLFDEYDASSGGQPDKLWIVDDANAVLTDWQKTCNGERNAARFLELYDCAALSESFRRNLKEEGEGHSRRLIDETSTSIVFGATFNVACFQGQSVRAGMARRFLYYTAERRGCDLFTTPPQRPEELDPLVAAFARCAQLEGRMTLAPDAEPRWLEYQAANRRAMDTANLLDEALIARLSSAPGQTLAVAMIFEAAMWAHRGGPWRSVLSLEALACAIHHVDECLDAARFLDGIAHRASLDEDAEVLYESITRDFFAQRRGATIYLTRSQLTRAYCPNPNRRNALKPNHLYERLIPTLVRQGKAVLAVKEGRLEVYAFRAEA